MKQRANYETEAIKLSKAIDIAIEAFKKFPPYMWTEDNFSDVEKCYIEWKNSALNPSPEYKKISSLKYKIEDVFTIFNEGSGEFVDYFWKEIKNQNLDYVREDKLYKILKRGKIKSRIKYDYVTDIIIVAEQEDRITKEESKLLSKMIGIFEIKK